MAAKPDRSAPNPRSGEGFAASSTRGGPEPTHLVKVLGLGAKLPVSGSRDRKIALIAAHQRGRVARRQLRAAGIGNGVVDRLIKRSMLFALHSGVFAVGHPGVVPLGRETAALLAVRDGAVLSHGTAAALWGLRPVDAGEDLIHVLVPGGSAASPAGVRVHRTRILAPNDVRVRHGLPVTSPARTLLDYAAELTERELEFLFDQAMVAKMITVRDVDEIIGRANGRNGRPALRALVERQRDPAFTRSEAEARFLGLIRAAQLPEPEVNARVHGYEVDFLWRAERLVVEIDGFRFHSTRHAFEHDRRKDAKLQVHGLATMRFTWSQLVRESYAMIARVAQALAAAARVNAS